MHIHWIKSDPKAISIGLAEIDSQSKLMEQKDRYPELAGLHPKKQLEFLATRELIQEMCERLEIPYHGIHKDEFGKPHLTDSTYHLSVSHSYPMVSCSLHPTSPCGIDIESPREQLLKIKHKFLNKEELAYCEDDLTKLCLHWAAKEALYKLYGRKSLNFAEQLAIRSISEENISSQIALNDGVENYTLNFVHFLEYIIVYSV